MYSAAVASGNFTNHSVVRFDPPFHNSSVPTATIVTPTDGGHVQDILTVSGTASDPSAPVVALDVMIDGVNRAHLVPTGSPLTWSTALNLPGLDIKPGSHTLSVRVTNSRGAFDNLPETPITFTMDEGTAVLPTVVLESPSDGATITGKLSIKGYAYNAKLRISAVDTLIDGFVYGPTTYGIIRNDICATLSPAPPNCPAIGFGANMTTVEAYPPIPDGPHTLRVRVRDQTGRLTLYPSTPLNITVRNGAAAPIVGVLESPAPNATLSGTVTLSGYVYSVGQTIVSAYVVVDGRSLAYVKLGVPREDACAALPQADACPNIGFTYSLDTTKLLNGPHVVGVVGVNSRGDYLIFSDQAGEGINVFVQN